MKKILLACGSGICTSTAVNGKVTKILNDRGYGGQFEITQCTVAEAPAKSVNFDLLIATTMAPKELKCPFISGVCFLTNVGTEPAIKQIIEFMES